ncbi:MAG: YfiR family protein [Acidobacteriota bacterium]|nr:YfiR family protein [Acidobacteriota bacterium]
MPKVLQVPGIILACAGLASAGVVNQEPQAEYTLKARFLLQFPEFVVWPLEAGLGDATKPFVLLVLGASPFERHLDETLGSRKVKGHPVKVVYSNDLAALDGCHMAFICASERGRLKEIMGRIGHRPVLTVGDTAGFSKKGVMINLSIEEDLPRFEINLGAARWNNLGMSAQLLNLARKVW